MKITYSPAFVDRADLEVFLLCRLLEMTLPFPSLPFPFFFFETESHYVVQVSAQGWPQTHNPSAFASLVWGLQTRTIKPRSLSFFFFWQ
jgi:hypothetical protein